MYVPRSGSRSVGCVLPFESVARAMSVALPERAGVFQLHSQRRHASGFDSPINFASFQVAPSSLLITTFGISSDDGATRNEAKLIGESKPDAWRLWECSWKTPARSGKATLIARATDSNGRTQPTERDPDRGTYMINHLLPITVEVK